MGGSGSGRRWGQSKKTTVEECPTINAQDFADIIRGGPGSYQSIHWRRTFVGFHVENEEPTGLPLRLNYRLGEGEKAQVLDYRVHLVKAVPHFGGVRWYFLCPLVVNGRPCLHRGDKLYLPPGGLYFGCRGCYGLTYTSSQESHKFDGMYKVLAANVGRGMTPQAVKRLLKAPR